MKALKRAAFFLLVMVGLAVATNATYQITDTVHDLIVGSNATVNNNLTVGGSATVTGTLATGSATITGSAHITGSAAIDGSAAITGSAAVSSSLTVSGTLTTTSATAPTTFANGPAGINSGSGTHLEFTEEYLTAPGTNDWFGTGASGTGAGLTVVAASTSSSSRPGIVQFSQGTTSSGNVYRTTSSYLAPTAWTDVVYEATWGVTAQSTSSQEFYVVFGLSQQWGSSTPYGCVFLYDPQNITTGNINSGNAQVLEAGCANGSTTNMTIVLLNGTSQNGSGAGGSITTCTVNVGALSLPNTNWINTKLVYSSGNAAFYVNGSLCTTLTTNVTSTVVNASIDTAKTVGATAEPIYVDRMRLAIDLPAVRSP